MTPPFVVLTSPRFERLFRSLVKRHRELYELRDTVFGILSTDPYNRSRRHPIKKLAGVKHGAGQYRLRLGRWRFRYDVTKKKVALLYCGLRREDIYR